MQKQVYGSRGAESEDGRGTSLSGYQSIPAGSSLGPMSVAVRVKRPLLSHAGSVPPRGPGRVAKLSVEAWASCRGR